MVEYIQNIRLIIRGLNQTEEASKNHTWILTEKQMVYDSKLFNIVYSTMTTTKIKSFFAFCIIGFFSLQARELTQMQGPFYKKLDSTIR